MNKRIKSENKNKLAVDIVELQSMLSLGRNSAAELGEAADAVLRVGRRKLYNVERIKNYLDARTGKEVKDAD